MKLDSDILYCVKWNCRYIYYCVAIPSIYDTFIAFIMYTWDLAPFISVTQAFLWFAVSSFLLCVCVSSHWLHLIQLSSFSFPTVSNFNRLKIDLFFPLTSLVPHCPFIVLFLHKYAHNGIWFIVSSKGLLLGGSGSVVNSLDVCQTSLKSLRCFYFQCVLSSQWKAVTVNLQILHSQL